MTVLVQVSVVCEKCGVRYNTSERLLQGGDSTVVFPNEERRLADKYVGQDIDSHSQSHDLCNFCKNNSWPEKDNRI
jgi:hypothetical protein